MSSRGYGFVAAILTLGISAPVAQAQTWRLSGRGGDSELGETPIVVALKVPATDGIYSLTGPTSGESIPAVVFRTAIGTSSRPSCPASRREGVLLCDEATAAARLAHFRRDPVPGAWSAVRQRLSRVGAAGPDPDGTRRNLIITLDDHPLTEYRIDTGNKPFFFPVIGPTGVSFTRAFPMETVPGEDRDHPHQRSFWFTHGNVNGVDFWSETKNAGTIREMAGRRSSSRGRSWRGSGPGMPGSHPAIERSARTSDTVTFYRTEGPRIIDFDVTIHASDGPVTFGDTKEGMFGLRVASSMDVKNKTGGRITNAEGLTDLKAWGEPSPWVDYVGPVQGKTVGIAILNHPQSFRYPTTWHVRDYGLFAANPFGGHDFKKPDKGEYTVPAGQSIRFAIA